jgi:hypothetical protein
LKSALEVPAAEVPASSGNVVGATWALSVTLAFVTLGGFALIFDLIRALIAKGMNLTEGWMALFILALLFILTIDLLIIRQLSRVLKSGGLSGDALQEKKKGPQPAESPEPRKLNEPRESPLASVTEHTTRSFEPVRRGRDTRP